MSAESIDSRFVDTHLRRSLWPVLKAIGFRRSGRTAWRDRPHAIQVVCVQSFNSYVAQGIGATTFSFGVPIGVFFPVVEERTPMSWFRGDPSRPAEWYCHARNRLGKGLSQEGEWIPGPLRDRPDVWFVRPDGSNVGAVVSDARVQILEVGIPWLERLADPREARRAIEEGKAEPLAHGLGGTSYQGGAYAIDALSTLIDDEPGPERGPARLRP